MNYIVCISTKIKTRLVDSKTRDELIFEYTFSEYTLFFLDIIKLVWMNKSYLIYLRKALTVDIILTN